MARLALDGLKKPHAALNGRIVVVHGYDASKRRWDVGEATQRLQIMGSRLVIHTSMPPPVTLVIEGEEVGKDIDESHEADDDTRGLLVGDDDEEASGSVTEAHASTNASWNATGQHVSKRSQRVASHVAS